MRSVALAMKSPAGTRAFANRILNRLAGTVKQYEGAKACDIVLFCSEKLLCAAHLKPICTR
jgi:hypothetical protein